MSAVVIVAVGSRGDVAPLTGVGVALREAGHDVSIAAYTPFGDMIRKCGLGFRELPKELDLAAEDVSPVKGLAAFASPAGMRSLGEDIIAAISDDPADVLLVSPFAEMAGHAVAEARGIPIVGLRLQPLSATASHPPAVLGAWSGSAGVNRSAADLGAWVVDRLYGGVVAGFRRDLGLPKTSARVLRRRRSAAYWPILHGYSPAVAPRPADWRPGLEVTGYWWPAPDVGWTPPEELTDFLAAGPPPVFVGFGSMMITRQRAQQKSELIAQAARRAGVRAILQAGWTGLDAVDDHVLTIGEAPHDWLFPRVAAVAHHCGAGTTAAGIRAGKPTIALRAYGDGPFWARRISDLGVGVTVIDQRKVTVDRFADAMRAAVTETRYREAAERLAARVAHENGAARVVRAVEDLLRQSQRETT